MWAPDLTLLSGAMTQAPDQTITARLLGLETTKTWSLIATLFGDLDGDELSGKALWSLLEPLGIKPEAMRVALHRLKKDGWIVSEKAGREVIYRLSDHALAETRAAQTDVYRQNVKFASGWRLVKLAPDADSMGGTHVALDKGLFLMPREDPLPKDALEMTLGTSIPVWAEDLLVPKHLRDQAAGLSRMAKEFLSKPPTSDTVTARLMFLHYWRKMALRPGTWAHIGLMPDDEMADCHGAITKILRETERTKPNL